MASLFDLFSNDNAQDAANAQIAAINQGKTQATGALDTGLNLATGSYSNALQPFLTNYNTAQGGQNAYADATGANGAAGNARAVQNFQASPAYQYTLDQGTQNFLRNQAATGQLNSGATDVGLQNLGQNTANQFYQQYVQNLQPFLQQSTNAATGIAGVNTGLGTLQNANRGQVASLDYGADTSQGNAQANADLANNQAAANQFGALKAGAGLAANLIGFL